MTGPANLKSRGGLKILLLARISPLVSLRPLSAVLIALAMLFAPFAMPSGAAMATAPADHHGQMMDKGHCGDQPAKGKADKAADKACCAAMCTAIAVAPASPAAPPVFLRSIEQPSLEQLSHSYLAKLPTPPPRRA